MNDIFNFKVKADEIIHDLKNDVEEFGAKKKTKDIKPMIQEIKESFQMIDEGSQKIINSL